MQLSPIMFSDNFGATYLSANPVFYFRLKHLAIDYHFVCDLVQWFELRVVHVSAGEYLIDAFTKPLSRSRLFYLCNNICVNSCTPSILRGHITVYLGFPFIRFMLLLFVPLLIYIYIYTSTLSIMK